MSAARVSTVQVDDGIKLYVQLFGDESRETRPLLIALHGAPGLFTSAEPKASFSHLSSLFRVLIFDGRGSGASDIIGPYTHERWMKDIDFLRYVKPTMDSHATTDLVTETGQAPRLSYWQDIRTEDF